MIHPSSIIDPTAIIDDSVEIGPFCLVGPNVEIGEETKIESHVILKGPTKIGKRNHIFQFSTLGDGSPDKKYNNEPTTLVIGDDNIIREGVTIHRGTIQDKSLTKIGSNNLFMAYAHVAHDCIVGDNNVFANNAGIAGHVVVGNSVIVGALTTVHQFCRLGDHSFAGMNTSINMDVPAYVKVAADPARVIGLNSVGMARNGIPDESISLLKKSYKVVYKRGLKLEDAIKKLEIMHSETNDLFLDSFIQSIKTSSRGILR